MADYDRWKKAVEDTFPFEEGQTIIDKDVVIELLYRSDQNRQIPYHNPGNFPYTRGGSSQLQKPLIMQKVNMRDGEEQVERRVKEMSEADIDCLQLILPCDIWSEEVFEYQHEIEKMIRIFQNTKVQLLMEAGKLQKPIIEKLTSCTNWHEKTQIKGAILVDPLQSLIFKNNNDQQKERYRSLADCIEMSIFPHIRLLQIDTEPYRLLGVNVVMELALAMAVGVEYIEQLRKHDIEPNEVSKKMMFTFSIGSYIGVEIAKLRAFRTLWASVMKEYKADPLAQQAWIEARTARELQVENDPHMSIVKATVSGLAAILGGANHLFIRPNLDEHLARQAALILRDEAFLYFPIDSVGGSYYIEALTEQLAEKSWNLFLDIERQGGIVAAWTGGWLEKHIMGGKI
ncbi:methylmalonyl-CoA mutase family protein [Bacillus sp. JCM 19034]|uniref:methylmalonyl-CoA mutase family protein n=1 Tax=Bacillus sp. JCM 19034 TaxID=1481928 RepID=UPI0007829999|nr:methylmalonyl-CoA mutase family protein [Bacillus sp. JCM 19034]